jgi:4-hydroxybenzoate polyprenyltransferase
VSVAPFPASAVRAPQQWRSADDAPGAPLCVDLDGTLLRTDLLHELVMRLVRQQPSALLSLPGWLLGGKAVLKQRLATLVRLDLSTLPLNEPLLDHLAAEHAKGRELSLLSAADDSLVQAFAARIGLFAWAKGSDGRLNLAGARKLVAIRERYGDAPFAYAGNAQVDMPIWGESAAAVVAGEACHRLREVERLAPIEASFPYGAAGVAGRARAWLRALRPHQWAKNLLLLAPVVLAGPLAGLTDFLEAGLGFVIFGLLASAGYVINDLLDLEADRRHRTKRLRPFAAGDLPIREGVQGALLLILLAAGLLFLMPLAFAPAAAAYFAGTLAYSLALKREPMLDVLALAGLFTVRVLAGASVLAVPYSFWLLTFSMFLFLSLALVKRYAELAELARTRSAEAIPGRGYTLPELPLVLSMGVTTAVAANIIFLVYLIEEKFPSGLYARPGWLWLVFPALMYWLMRVWRLAVQGKMHEDPVSFALRDRVSLALGAVVLGLLLLAR